jgi:hypothetical protein
LRWKYDIERTYFSAERSAYRDLREVSHGAKATRFHIHISAKNKLDTIHARQLSSYRTVPSYITASLP